MKKMTVFEAIESVDIEDVIDRMSAFAYSRLKSYNLKNFNGVEPIDFVNDVILKVIEGKRDWIKADCSFKEFLFGCLKSDISNFFKTNKAILTDKFDIIPHNDDMEFSYLELKEYTTSLLKKEGADNDELAIFDFWVDGTRKPLIISQELEIDVKEVYAITKRLERRLVKIKPYFRNN